MRVALIFRKPQPQYYSIEKVFTLVSDQLQHSLSILKVFMPHHAVSIINLFRNIQASRKQKADLYHVTGDVHYVVLGLPSKRTILTIHDCIFMQQSRGLKRLLVYHLFLKWPVKKSTVVTTISENTRQDIIRFTNCSPEKIVVIANPLNERFHFTPYEFNKSEPVLLFVGITPNKNMFRVIDALEGLACRLHVIGKIPDAERQALITKRIVFTESFELSEQQLIDAYVKSDIVLFPSTFEGFGLPIIEAQQTGRPVITSNISPMKEVAGDGACLVDPFSVASIREGIDKIIKDDLYRQSLITKGLSNTQKYKPEVIAEAYAALYHRLHAE